jgi:hypothetical protein
LMRGAVGQCEDEYFQWYLHSRQVQSDKNLGSNPALRVGATLKATYYRTTDPPWRDSGQSLTVLSYQR